MGIGLPAPFKLRLGNRRLTDPVQHSVTTQRLNFVLNIPRLCYRGAGPESEEAIEGVARCWFLPWIWDEPAGRLPGVLLAQQGDWKPDQS